MGETQKKEKKKIGLTTKILLHCLQERYLELFYVMRFQVDISKTTLS